MPEAMFFKPDVSLQWFVRQFETIRSGTICQPLDGHFIPRPDAAIVFHFKAIPTIIHPSSLDLAPVFIAPVSSIPVRLFVKGELDTFVVICKASVLSRLFGLNMAKISFVLGLSGEEIISIREQMLSACREDRVKIFSGYVHKLVPDGYQKDYIDDIYDDILENCLQKPLQRIIVGSHCSPSTLQRNFIKRTGVSMKKMLRIARVHSIIEKMLTDRSFNYQEFVYDGNYYDQAHFIKDFVAITGSSPRKFFYGNTKMNRVLSGMNAGDVLL